MLAKLGMLIGWVSDSSSLSCLAALAGGFAFSLLEYAVMSSLPLSGISPEYQTLLDSAIIGAGAAFFLWLLLLDNRHRRRRVAEDLTRIAELNHEIRNALQVIAHAQYVAGAKESEMVLTSVSRIDAVLKRLFPIVGLPSASTSRKQQGPSPEEGPGRQKRVSL